MEISDLFGHQESDEILKLTAFLEHSLAAQNNKEKFSVAQPSIPIEKAIVFQVPQPSVSGDELVDTMQPDIVAVFQGILPVQGSSNFQKPHGALALGWTKDAADARLRNQPSN